MNGEASPPVAKAERVHDAKADPAAFYRAHAEQLTRFATSMVGPGDAQDVVANAIAKTLSARKWSTIENPRAYLYRAVYREATSWRRLGARRAFRRAIDAEHLSASDRAVEPNSRQLHAHVIAAVAGLSARQRAVVVLTYWADQPVVEVARILGTSEGAVKKHLARARRALRAVLSVEEEL